MADETIIRHIDGKYRMVYERSAVKGVDGFKVEANSDSLDQVEIGADTLYQHAIARTRTEGG